MTARMQGAAVAAVALAALLWGRAGSDQAEPVGGRFLGKEAAELSDVLGAPAGPLEPRLGRLLDQTVAWEALAQRAFGEYLEEYLERSLDRYARPLEAGKLDRLVGHYRTVVAQALRQRAVRDLAQVARSGRITGLLVVSHSLQDGHGQIEFAVQSADSLLSLQGQLQRASATWQLVDLEVGGRWLSQHYREECRRVVAPAYAPAVLEACLLQRDYIVLEDFSGARPGELPPDWGLLYDKDQGKPLLYAVGEHRGKHYLAARDTGLSVIIGKFVQWNPREYPIMTWCWRADALPAGGDERYKDTNDSAAGIYVVFSQNWLGVPKQIKYVWSTTLPVGTVDRRNQAFKPWFHVLESGRERLGAWTFEQVDLYAHHEEKLGGRPDDRTISLGILTDANATDSYAEARYADIRVWTREALAAGRVRDYCDCLSDAAPGSARSNGQNRRDTP
ncbi:MAG: DUF3047 domain-containing protein [Candidatus Latescibacterota bacterium]